MRRRPPRARRPGTGRGHRTAAARRDGRPLGLLEPARRLPRPGAARRPGSPARSPFLVYLRVWERTVSAAEDPALREVALGAALPDTTVRAKVVWQVLPLP
ncbi:DUF6519 domain-containing protein [Streptomyces nogalater]